MNHRQAFAKLRNTGTDGEDAYLTMLCAATFAPAIAVTANGTGVRYTADDALGEFTLDLCEEMIPV